MTGTPMTLGFIGLGSQGAPMAQALIDAGHDTVLWARRPDSVKPFESRARIASSAAEVAELADIIGICVRDDEDVIEVALGPKGLLAGITPGTTVLIHSTVHPVTCRQLGTRFSEHHAHLLDAPVSGGGHAARAGQLLVMVGGDHDIFRTVAPALSAFGDPVVHVGALGAGQLAKLLNNLLLTATLGLTHDTAELASALGVDGAALMGILPHASGRSYAVQMYGGLLGDLRPPSARVRFIADLLGKDVAIAEDLAAHAQGGDLLLSAAHRILTAMGHDPCP